MDGSEIIADPENFEPESEKALYNFYRILLFAILLLVSKFLGLFIP
jgi:hypothetical protein